MRKEDLRKNQVLGCNSISISKPEDIMEIIKYLQESGLLIKIINKAIKR